MHHNILLRFEFILIALAKIANHNKYITNRYLVKQKKAEDILSSCFFAKTWSAFIYKNVCFVNYCFYYFSML